jgi:addiction module HigA family antidote
MCDRERSKAPAFRLRDSRRDAGATSTCSARGLPLNLEQEAIVSIKNEGPAGWAVHPGEILREEFLEPMGISGYRLAVELRVSPPTVNDIVREKRGITPEMAARLAKYFGTSEQFWLNLQDAFAVHQVKEKLHKELRAIKPFAAAAAR